MKHCEVDDDNNKLNSIPSNLNKIIVIFVAEGYFFFDELNFVELLIRL